jgi:glycosyltransferase involved in cell wall biosynthesis
MNPAVSVMMPVYNAERYIAEAVQSILDQTFADFELLVVDDGSTDRSPSILRRFADRDPRVRLVSRENRGISATRNELLSMALGEYVAVMDADDVSLPERLAVEVAYLRAHPDVVCVASQVHVIDELGRFLCDSHPGMDHDEIQEIALRGTCPLCHSSTMMRREVVAALGGYREGMQPSEDHDLFLRLGEVGRLVGLPDILVKYRNHGRSISVTQQERQGDLSKVASDQACDRRGIARRYVPQGPWRPFDRRSLFDFLMQWGWAGFMRGDRRLALIYGAKAARLMPWRADAWRLLACAALKPAGRGA